MLAVDGSGGKARVRVALATTNGRDVDAHFGQATRFVVYDLGGDNAGAVFVEERVTLPYSATGHGGVPEALRDCRAVVAAQAGQGAATTLIRGGVRVFEATGPIGAVLASLARMSHFRPDRG